MGDFLPVPFPGPKRGGNRERGHMNSSKTGGTGPTRPDEDGPRELDSVLCHHRSTCCSAQGAGRVLDGVPLGLPPRETDCNAEAERPAGGGSPG